MKKYNLLQDRFGFRRSILVAGFVIGLMGVAVFPAHAQSLALAPAQVQYQFKPGQPFQFALSVSNKGSAPVILRVSATDFWYNDKNEKLFSVPGTSPRSAANWIELVPHQLTVPAVGTATVQVVVTPPLQTSGGYYAVIFVESTPVLTKAAAEGKGAVYTNMRLGSLLLLSAEDTEKTEIGISSARFTPPSFNQALSLDFLLDNQSNTHIFPQPAVAILNSRHELIAKSEGDKKRFLPGQKDHLSVSWAGTLTPGKYSAILTVLYGRDNSYTQEFPFAVAGPDLNQSPLTVAMDKH